MATQMQLEVILTGNRIGKWKAEIVSVSVFSKVLSLD